VWPLLYLAGFALLPRQLRAQRENAGARADKQADGVADGTDIMRGRDSMAPLTAGGQPAPAHT
jgi:hypothetical protein